ncbi:hypothetical protein A3Q56_04699, partial [Intoshia linei]
MLLMIGVQGFDWNTVHEKIYLADIGFIYLTINAVGLTIIELFMDTQPLMYKLITHSIVVSLSTILFGLLGHYTIDSEISNQILYHLYYILGMVVIASTDGYFYLKIFRQKWELFNFDKIYIMELIFVASTIAYFIFDYIVSQNSENLKILIFYQLYMSANAIYMNKVFVDERLVLLHPAIKHVISLISLDVFTILSFVTVLYDKKEAYIVVFDLLVSSLACLIAIGVSYPIKVYSYEQIIPSSCAITVLIAFSAIDILDIY